MVTDCPQCVHIGLAWKNIDVTAFFIKVANNIKVSGMIKSKVFETNWKDIKSGAATDFCISARICKRVSPQL